MSERKELDETEGKLVTVIDEPVPIELTLKGKGEKGRKEIETFLETLSKLRQTDLKTAQRDGELTAKGQILRLKKSTEYMPPAETRITEYKTQEGMLLTLTEEPNGRIDVRLEEDLKLENSRNKIGYLAHLIKILTTATNSKEKTIPAYGSEKKVVEIIVSDVKEFMGLEVSVLQEISLYKNLQESLKKAIEEIGKTQKINPDKVANDIQYWTNLAGPNIKKQLLLTDLAYFMRELYGVIQAETGVTMHQIRSELKSRAISENRHAAMYTAHNRFPEISSTDLGRVFGTPERPKNHATVLLAVNGIEGICPYNENVGLQLKEYTDRRRNARTLYTATVKKRVSFLRKNTSSRIKPSKEIFQLRN